MPFLLFTRFQKVITWIVLALLMWVLYRFQLVFASPVYRNDQDAGEWKVHGYSVGLNIPILFTDYAFFLSLQATPTLRVGKGKGAAIGGGSLHVLYLGPFTVSVGFDKTLTVQVP